MEPVFYGKIDGRSMLDSDDDYAGTFEAKNDSVISHSDFPMAF